LENTELLLKRRYQLSDLFPASSNDDSCDELKFGDFYIDCFYEHGNLFHLAIFEASFKQLEHYERFKLPDNLMAHIIAYVLNTPKNEENYAKARHTSLQFMNASLASVDNKVATKGLSKFLSELDKDQALALLTKEGFAALASSPKQEHKHNSTSMLQRLACSFLFTKLN
jgi:hypothetical protein